MEYEKGDRVVVTRAVDGHKAGVKGAVIRVETAWFSSTRYAVLLDETGEVVEQLVDDDLYCPERDSVR
ncbi:hypothetical protein [Micromonospora zamorensis]|uniref:hypothetical protein n=1 Tax=Micromonospora zamorensis TaxID=709883 RepID=UPI00349A056B